MVNEGAVTKFFKGQFHFNFLCQMPATQISLQNRSEYLWRCTDDTQKKSCKKEPDSYFSMV